jgi:hypothetical protein
MWTRTIVTRTSHRVALGGILIWTLTASSGGAQTTVLTSVPVYPGVLIQTGLLTYVTGASRTAEVTVTELGSPGATSTVRVTFYDETERAIFKDEGTLKRGQPVHVVLPLSMPQRNVRLRASVLIFERAGKKTVPVTVLESGDIDSFTILVACSPPEEKQDIQGSWCPPPGVGVATDIAVPE